MKIAILNCLKANEVCAGAACLRAVNTGTRSFERYEDTPELVAFARCNGCGAGIDKGFTEKLERMVSEGTQVIHLGVCTRKFDTKEECPTITEAARWLENHGIEVIRGTH